MHSTKALALSQSKDRYISIGVALLSITSKTGVGGVDVVKALVSGRGLCVSS